MTDITELALREKFEAWWEREYKHLESSKYTDAVPHIKYGFWMAYQAGGAELVEALEKAQQRIVELESRTVTVRLPDPPGPMSVGARTVYFGTVDDVVSAFQYGLNAAGIKVEAE
ncbi:Uncharacterised protein [Klebsiella pneumoniae]|uniref:hypothetical protein n=1 Tax=Klebsiella pneumoniae TaxID=573 RepID=UPI000E2E19F4|nr:hypothetical protein [Klebsiella pneumoniae]SXT80267.1 Uncharacterised protein [Klebsiella pneumoniae]